MPRFIYSPDIPFSCVYMGGISIYINLICVKKAIESASLGPSCGATIMSMVVHSIFLLTFPPKESTRTHYVFFAFVGIATNMKIAMSIY